jgi:hypothetical protein
LLDFVGLGGQTVAGVPTDQRVFASWQSSFRAAGVASSPNFRAWRFSSL